VNKRGNEERKMDDFWTFSHNIFLLQFRKKAANGKIKRGIRRLSGKSGDEVYVDSQPSLSRD
jgi:hypothetical protein